MRSSVAYVFRCFTAGKRDSLRCKLYPRRTWVCRIKSSARLFSSAGRDTKQHHKVHTSYFERVRGLHSVLGVFSICPNCVGVFSELLWTSPLDYNVLQVTDQYLQFCIAPRQPNYNRHRLGSERQGVGGCPLPCFGRGAILFPRQCRIVECVPLFHPCFYVLGRICSRVRCIML